MDVDAVRAWIAEDPDPDTARELTELLATATAAPGPDSPDGDAVVSATAELEDRFSGPLAFGTAGLRGALGGGPNRMNRAVVLRTAAGLAAFLAERLDGQPARVVIGYDARHGSAQFARDTAAVVTAAGGKAMLLPSTLPTPVLAFAVRHLDADAGVMVTASHNPPADNGYKVYLGGRVVTGSGRGAQIVPPYDAEIAAHIAAVGPLSQVRVADGGWDVLTNGILEDYLTRVASLVPAGHARSLKIVLTPMHGVGGATTVEALRRAGFTDVHVVPEQAQPDPDFPTVAFPNPEEPGALDLSFELARHVRANLVIANDPDADRCSVAVPDHAAAGGWRQLTGDEVGTLLGEQAAVAAAMVDGGVLANSIVSSRLLAKVAVSHGLEHRTTLTGFKWISRVEGLVFGYEEALGYCVDPAAVRDKDGISAAVRIAFLASQLADRGLTLRDELDRLAVRHGVHATAPLSVRVADLSLIGAAMTRLRSAGPTHLAGSPMAQVADLSQGYEGLPPTDGLLYLSEAGDRVIIRPSGTEPKLKCYLEVIEPVADADALGAARERAAERLSRIRTEIAAAVGL
ncbi:phospho-sugar mutase [Georgenia faecalis]|uniref:Phospho-sugar mutase n=1 Tax=Georgenia faecalis TaxID=2483799 RepID=A0ABV9D6C7_9MICO|nr:phospho-sugar mutase [Georgenia faecalis]